MENLVAKDLTAVGRPGAKGLRMLGAETEAAENWKEWRRIVDKANNYLGFEWTQE